MKKVFAIVALFAALALPMSAVAQEGEDVAATSKATRLGLGVHLGYPTLAGFSMKAWLSPRFGAQAMGSAFTVGDVSLTMLGGRVLFKLSKGDEKITPYLAAGAGVWIAKDDKADYDWTTGKYEEDKETATILQFIIGFQHRYSTNFSGDYEFGYVSVSFDDVDVDVSGMSFALAFHYFFDL